MAIRRWLLLTLPLIATLTPACTTLLVSGGTTAASVAADRRTAGAYLDDTTIELKARKAIVSDPEFEENSHINITSVNAVVLLTGETTTTALRDRALAHIREINGVRRIVNEITIAEPTPYSSRSHDTWITGKVKIKLIGTENLPSTHVKVVTENSVVYLMGLVSQKEGQMASDATRTVDGVKRVVKLFEYLD